MNLSRKIILVSIQGFFWIGRIYMVDLQNGKSPFRSDAYKVSGLPIFASLGIPLRTMAEIPKPPDSYREGLGSSLTSCRILIENYITKHAIWFTHTNTQKDAITKQSVSELLQIR